MQETWVWSLGWEDRGVRNDTPLQYFSLENSMDRRTWEPTVHRVAKCWLWLSNSLPTDSSSFEEFCPEDDQNNGAVGGSIRCSHSVVSDSLQAHEPPHARLPCPSPTPGVHPNPCPFSRWCHPTISSSVVPFSCPQYFPTLGSFQMSQLFTSGERGDKWAFKDIVLVK